MKGTILALAVAAAVMLAGCSGGNKGGTGTSDAESTSVREPVRALLVNADSFTASNGVATARTGQSERFAVSCMGTTCTALGVSTGRTDSLNTLNRNRYTSEGVYREVNMATGSLVRPLTGISSGVLYGGWLNHHGFSIEEVIDTDGIEVVGSSMFGDSSSSGSVSNLGRVTYNGVMVGMNSSGLTRTQYRGDVQMQYGGSLIDVTISNIRNRSTNFLDGRTLGWVNVPVSGNTFGGTVNQSNYLRGKFYGPNAEEAGAVFEQQGITGAFGTRR